MRPSARRRDGRRGDEPAPGASHRSVETAGGRGYVPTVASGESSHEVRGEPATLIYDGDCEFCRRQVDRVEGWDRNGRIQPIPFQSADLERYGVDRSAAEEAMHLITPRGEVFRGAEAAREVLRRLPGLRWAAAVFAIPGVPAIAERVYRWIARRRHRFGCSSGVCGRGDHG